MESHDTNKLHYEGNQYLGGFSLRNYSKLLYLLSNQRCPAGNRRKSKHKDIRKLNISRDITFVRRCKFANGINRREFLAITLALSPQFYQRCKVTGLFTSYNYLIIVWSTRIVFVFCREKRKYIEVSDKSNVENWSNYTQTGLIRLRMQLRDVDISNGLKVMGNKRISPTYFKSEVLPKVRDSNALLTSSKSFFSEGTSPWFYDIKRNKVKRYTSWWNYKCTGSRLK